MRTLVQGLLGWLGFGLCAAMAQTPAYPQKPIRMVVPYAAGGNADITARVMARKMSEGLGQPIVIENKGGANGGIGTDMVAKAAPDGYTVLMVASGPIVINPVLYDKVNYDPQRDLQPVSLVLTYQYALVTQANAPWRSVSELIQSAREQPGRLSYGSAGIGAGGHLAAEWLAHSANVKLSHVPYKGNAPALADLLGGVLSFTFDTVVTSAPHVRSGRLRALAVSGAKRAQALPLVPTLQELGYKDFDIHQFVGLMVPAKTDAAIVRRLQEEVVRALKSPEVIERLQHEGGNELVGSTPEEFANVIAAELTLYRQLISNTHVSKD
jgi:tripartite-type tricarboxylate transporter receptor subunit TctC